MSMLCSPHFFVDDRHNSGFDIGPDAASFFFEPMDYSGSDSSTDWSSELDGYEGMPPSCNEIEEEDQTFHSERERLKTFDGVWKQEYNVTKEDLAQDGFIYKGPADKAKCVFCSKSIWKWDAGDSVPGEHKRLYPECPWVLGKAHDLNVPVSRNENMKKNMRVAVRNQPKFSDMSTEKARRETFKGWVKRKSVTVDSLAQQGYFYDKYSDTLTCYHCGTNINGWNMENNLCGLHAESSPNCPMVRPKQPEQHTVHNVSLDRHLAPHTECQAGARVLGQKEESPMCTIDDDMKSPAVLAIVMSYGDDYSRVEIKEAVQSLRAHYGSGHILTAKEILKKLDTD